VSAASGPAIDLELVSFLSFWTDAGVDLAYADAAQDRLKAPARSPAPKAPVPRAIAAPTANAAAPEISVAAVDALRLAEGAADLAALEAAIAAFDGCPLKTQGATRAVFARGRPDAPVMIIGEGPGVDEDRQGQPFVGRAGKLLDRMLAAAGLLDQVFITNTVFWRPPGNRTPTLAEQAACRPFVERAIALVKPKVLVLAGGASAKSMLDTSEGILSLHGRWRDWTSADGAITLPALPTLHPAFLLRQSMAKKKAWADLLTLTAKLDPPSGEA
jgi:uracil-DNA glycosylase family 4